MDTGDAQPPAGRSDNSIDAQWRPAYRGATLPADLPAAPWDIVDAWLREAAEDAAEGAAEPNAAALATADADGLPDVRIVLVKSASPRGFVIYTDAGSAKAQQLSANPQAALTFYWPSSTRQVRVRGAVEHVEPEVAAEYFGTRPRESQIAAAASHQSQPIESRQALVARFEAKRAELQDHEAVPVPDQWIGFRIRPIALEVWAGDSDRLHDRAEYRAEQVSLLDDSSAWVVSRLQP